MEVRLRLATPADDAFIVQMARHACVIENRSLPESDSGDVQGLLPRSGDVVIVAVGMTGTLLGAVWTFENDPPLRIGDAVLPELVIAVTPEARGKGVGGKLLDDLFTRCAGRCDGLCLNVHVRNPASHLYERKGFDVMGQGRGALGVAMRKTLA